MMTAEQFLKQDVGALVANLLFQIALLKAENEQLRAARSPLVSENGVPTTEPRA